MVMEKVQTLLENADTPELLISVVDAIQYIAKIYPHVFNIHFRVSSCTLLLLTLTFGLEIGTYVYI